MKKCTYENPAPTVYKKQSWYPPIPAWNFSYEHPFATSYELKGDHEDYRYTCPCCKMSYVAEGSDY